MKNSKTKLNIIASVVGLILTANVVFFSASSQTASNAAISTPIATVIQDPTIATIATTTDTSSVQPSTQTQGAAVSQATAQVVTTNTSGYVDGTYTATANYPVRGSVESIGVTLTLQNGIVSNTSITQSGSDPESRRYQSAFAAAYKQYVVGKSISSLNLSRVSGSSLTTSGFNNALAQIKSEAQA